MSQLINLSMCRTIFENFPVIFSPTGKFYFLPSAYHSWWLRARFSWKPLKYNIEIALKCLEQNNFIGKSGKSLQVIVLQCIQKLRLEQHLQCWIMLDRCYQWDTPRERTMIKMKAKSSEINFAARKSTSLHHSDT